jgi:hypothetical protein
MGTAQLCIVVQMEQRAPGISDCIIKSYNLTHGTENPRAGGSIPPLATCNKKNLNDSVTTLKNPLREF